jgi:hypothetical protein
MFRPSKPAVSTNNSTKPVLGFTKNNIFLFSLFSLAFLSLFAAPAQSQSICSGNPCILISNYNTGQVEIWPDTGGSSSLTTAFLTGGPSGRGGGEGIACVHGNSNVMYVSDNGSDVLAFNLSSGAYIGPAFSGGSEITGMAINGAGNIIYAADYGDGAVWTLVPNGPYSLSPYAAETLVSAGAHDVALGTSPTALAGDVFTSYFDNPNTGASQFESVGTYSSLLFQGDALPYPVSGPYTNGCATFTNGTHCWTRITGMVFDALGNLWANSATSGDNGTFEFTQSGSTPPEFVPLNFTPSVTIHDFPIGITIAPTGDINAGNILTADFSAGTISMISPTSCTGTVSTPGACTRTNFIPNVGNNPKYVVYNQSCPSVADDGYIEVCKQSNPSLPVTGTFDFTITASQFNSGPIPVPVGECSGPIQVPSGTVTVTETPQSPITVTGVSAYAYNSSGGLVDEVVAYPAQNPPNPYAAEVGVEPGNDVALETIATFTNSNYNDGQTGQLKICKVAGPGIEVGQSFNFTASAKSAAGAPSTTKYSVEAGPGPQGYCTLAGTYPVGTQVTVKETLPKGDYTSIKVQPPSNAGAQTASSVAVTIGQGVTEVTFTNTTTKPGFILGASPTSVTIAAGATATSTITVTPVGGFAGNVSMSASGLPKGVKASFSPNPTTTTSTVTFSAGTTTPAGTSTVTIVGKSGMTSATTTISLTVQGATVPTVSFTGAPASASEGSNFTVTASSNETTGADAVPKITAGGSCSIGTANNTGPGAYQATVTISKAAGTCKMQAAWAATVDYAAASAMQTTTAD